MMKFARRFRDLGIEGEKARQYDEFSRKYRMGDFREYASLAARHVGEGGIRPRRCDWPGVLLY